jgi:hypothetical protein
MKPTIPPLLFALLLFVGMVAFLELGRRLARRHEEKPDADKASLATVETALFALFGLLVAFTFSGAASRFQEKRMLVVQEANAIEAAYRTTDLVAPESQAALRQQFRDYVNARLEVYRRLPDMVAARAPIARAEQLQDGIWTAAIAATRVTHADPSGARMLIPAVEDMVRVNRTRMISLQNHPPEVVYLLLFFLGLLCSLLAGFRMGARHRSWLHMLSFPLLTAAVVYVTIDIEYPRVGFIRLERADQALEDVRARMK